MYINAMAVILLAFWLQMMTKSPNHAHLLNQAKTKQNGGRFNELMQILPRITLLFKAMHDRMRAIHKKSNNAYGEIMVTCDYRENKDCRMPNKRGLYDEVCQLCLIGQQADELSLLNSAIANMTASIEERLRRDRMLR